MEVKSVLLKSPSFRRCHKRMGYFVFLFFSLFLLVACETEELLRTTDRNLANGDVLTKVLNPASLDFFYTTDARLESVIFALRSVEHEKHFVDSFCLEYGVPLWDFSYRLEEEGDICLFVPLYQADTPCAINAVWLLHIADGLMKYAPLTCDDELLQDNDQSFLFDLLSYKVFGDNNSKGLSFKTHPMTRGWLTVTQCWDVYTGTAEHLEFSYSNCVDKTYWVEDALVFHSISNTDGGGSGSINVGGGVDGANTSASNSKAGDLFERNNQEQDSILWRITENIVDRMIQDCMGGDLYNGIKQKYGDNKINLEFIFGEGASFEIDGHTLKFGLGNLESNVMMHELFHAYQATRETAASFKGALMNREIEAHYAQYLYLQRSVEWTDEKKDKYSKNQRLRAAASLDTYVDDHGNLVESNKELFDCYLSENVVSSFRKDGYEDYSFNENEDLPFTFSNIKALTKNCK